MQIEWSRLILEERERCFRVLARAFHWQLLGLTKTTLSLGVMVHGSSLPKPCLLILLKLCHQQASHSLQAFLDSASQKELQCFLGFPTFIFNQRFIRDYSKVASPHTGLIFPKLCLCLVHRSRSSLLKTEDSVHICVSVGSLSHQTPFLWWRWRLWTLGLKSKKCPFSSTLDPKGCCLFPTFISCRTQGNDISDWELQPIKLVLEEWCHWLEGMEWIYYLDWPQKPHLLLSS